MASVRESACVLRAPLCVPAVLLAAVVCAVTATASRQVDAGQARCGDPKLLQRAMKESSGLLGKPGSLQANSCATFPLELYRRGKLVLRGSCYVHALQFANYAWVEYRVNQTWLLLPKGTWLVRDALRATNGGTGGTLTQDRRRLAAPGRITVHGHLRGMGGALPGSSHRHTRMSARLACGVLLGHPAASSADFVPTEKSFATIVWPSFKLLGINAPVDPFAPDGGLTP